MPPSILISGAGPSSLPLALFLLLQPLPAPALPKITIIDRTPTLSTKGQNIDIRGTGLTLLRHLGLEKRIRAATTGEEGVMFVDSANRTWGKFDADRSGRYDSGTADVEILRGELVRVLKERVEEVDALVREQGGEGVEFRFGERVVGIEQDGEGVDVDFSSGKRKRFDLVVGADGLHSGIRKLVWGEKGEEERVRRIGMYQAFFSMPAGKNDGGYRRWYTAPGRRGMMVRPHGEEGKATVFMFVVNEDDERLREVVGTGRAAVQKQKEVMASYFKDAGWECPRIVEEMEKSEDFYYDMVAQIKTEKWSKGRVVLLGDAGYCASPLSGMGTTLALNGAYNLAGALHQHPNDVEAALSQYEEKMLPLVTKAQKLSPVMPWLMNPETMWGVFILRLLVATMYWSGVFNLVFLFVGPQANVIPVEDFGLRKLSEGKLHGTDIGDKSVK
ncbi:FAD-binding domain-containing protein 62 [Elsinoe fawcettii]|nr:FAD-binding domain-containing protein 62 [Elsinoe fawcettii]